MKWDGILPSHLCLVEQNVAKPLQYDWWLNFRIKHTQKDKKFDE